MRDPTYTFVSVSTAKPGMLDELVRVARRPNELMAEKVSGLIATQVSVDRDKEAVVVWATFTDKDSLYAYMDTDDARQSHGEDEDLSRIIASFQMFDMTPVSGRL